MTPEEEVKVLRARIAALEEAGEGLVNVLHYVQTGPETDDGAPLGPGPALARWRETSSGADRALAVKSGQGSSDHAPDNPPTEEGA